MSELQQVFRPDELLLRFRCKCGAEITLDAKTAALNPHNPPDCPSCHASLENFGRAVTLYRQFMEYASSLNVRLATSSAPQESGTR